MLLFIYLEIGAMEGERSGCTPGRKIGAVGGNVGTRQRPIRGPGFPTHVDDFACQHETPLDPRPGNVVESCEVVPFRGVTRLDGRPRINSETSPFLGRWERQECPLPSTEPRPECPVPTDVPAEIGAEGHGDRGQANAGPVQAVPVRERHEGGKRPAASGRNQVRNTVGGEPGAVIEPGWTKIACG